MRPLVVRLALASSLTCCLGAIQCASGPDESTPSSAPAAEPAPPPPAAAREAGAIAPRSDELAVEAPPPAPITPVNDLTVEAPPPAPVTPASAPGPAAEPSRKLEVVARLVEPDGAPHCGIMHWVVVMRYEIIHVVEGTYGERELYVAHSCPEMGTTRCRDLPGAAVKAFRAGDVHHLHLDRRSRGGALVDKFTDKRLPRYHVRCGNLAPPGSP